MDIISNSEIFLRLFITLVITFGLGLERELKDEPAGLRTHILIGVGSCLLMIISIMVPEIYNSNINDPGRIAAQVVSGVGFLGAGAIMKIGLNTRGLTTAANIWVTSAIGLTLGAGLYVAAFLTTALILFNLIIITKIKKHYIVPSKFCVINIRVLKKDAGAERMHAGIMKLPIKIISKDIKEDGKYVNINVISKIKTTTNIFKLKGGLQKIAPLQKISISENIKG